MKQSDSEEQIEKARKGDLQAVETILNEYKSKVKRLARTYFLMGGDTDDLIQEGMIGLYKALRDYDTDKGNRNFSAFAVMCINRNMQSAIKKARRFKHKPLNESISLYKENDNEEELINYIVNEEADNPLDIVLRAEQYSQLKDTIEKKLSKLEKSVLKEYLNGFSYIQIAEKLNKSVKAVDNTLQRIKQKLALQI